MWNPSKIIIFFKLFHFFSFIFYLLTLIAHRTALVQMDHINKSLHAFNKGCTSDKEINQIYLFTYYDSLIMAYAVK